MWSAIGRATARQVRVGGRLSIRTASRLAVLAPRTALAIPSGIRVAAVFVRGFAAAAPASKATKATASTATKKKPAAKTTAVKATRSTKKTTTAKTRAPAVKKAKATKPKPKPKPKRKARKPLTPEEAARLKIRELRKAALVKEEPTSGPRNVWSVFVASRMKDAGEDAHMRDSLRKLAPDFKALSAEELQVSRTGNLPVPAPHA
jgi:hypothetical protein